MMMINKNSNDQSARFTTIITHEKSGRKKEEEN